MAVGLEWTGPRVGHRYQHTRMGLVHVEHAIGVRVRCGSPQGYAGEARDEARGGLPAIDETIEYGETPRLDPEARERLRALGYLE